MPKKNLILQGFRLRLRSPFLYLASQSARRKEILRALKIKFKVIRSNYEENHEARRNPATLVLHHAKGKVLFARAPEKGRYVLGADTLVVCGKRILGKPKTWKEAKTMIQRLSGRAHFVYTGMVLRDIRNEKIYSGVVKTKVYVKKLNQREIENYVKKIRPFDKAGAYAIQTQPLIIDRIQGSYTNVVGLPVELLAKMIQKIKTHAAKQKKI